MVVQVGRDVLAVVQDMACYMFKSTARAQGKEGEQGFKLVLYTVWQEQVRVAAGMFLKTEGRALPAMRGYDLTKK